MGLPFGRVRGRSHYRDETGAGASRVILRPGPKVMQSVSMINVKVSLQGAVEGASYDSFTSSGTNEVDGVRFHLNQDMDAADVWLVVEGPAAQVETCIVPEGALVHLTAEPARPPGYLTEAPGLAAFMSQFDSFYTCLDFVEPNGFATLPFLPWMINANHGPSIFFRHERTVEYLESLTELPKSGELSVICSTQDATPEHRVRLRFVEALAEALGDRLHWYGNGKVSVAEKWDAIAPYRYSIAMENRAETNSITEKIQDVFLGLAFPIYWGAPNIGSYFDSDSYLAIDARDFPGSLKAIEALLEEDPYESRLEALRRSRATVLGELNFTNRMAAIARDVERVTKANGLHNAKVESIERIIRRSSRAQVAAAAARAGRGLDRFSRRLSA